MTFKNLSKVQAFHLMCLHLGVLFKIFFEKCTTVITRNAEMKGYNFTEVFTLFKNMFSFRTFLNYTTRLTD